MTFDQDRLIDDVVALREMRKLSLRQAAAEAGVDASTLSRVERGKTPDVRTLALLIDWLGLPAGRFFTTASLDRGDDPNGVGPADMVVHLEDGSQLHIEVKGSSRLTATVADRRKLERIFAVAYEELAGPPQSLSASRKPAVPRARQST
jgi:DNA-binding XRE family transcriptional regulator